MGAATERRVRVTLEGTASVVSGSGITRVRLDDGPSIIVDTAWSSVVALEDVAPARTWTKGDVLAGDIAYTRNANGVWSGVSPLGNVINWSDAEVEDALADPDGGMELLRYQAGGQ